MPDASALLPFVLLGLLGSAHCAGMCGGFALAAVARERARGRAVVRGLAYALGKALTYATLGLAAATLVGSAARGGFALDAARRGMAWLAGLVMLGFGLAALGLRLPAPARLPAFAVRAAAWARVTFGGVTRLPGYAGALGAGLLSGLLPCGLSWSAFALGAASEPGTAALGLFLFGLGTSPALLAVAFGGRLLATHRRALALRLAGPLLVAFGVLTVLRGGLPVPLAAGERVLPECCAEGADPGHSH